MNKRMIKHIINHRQRRNRLGFSLVELAVYISVAGLVVSGIWAAASSVSENFKVTETATGFFLAATNTQNLISFSDAKIIPYGSYITDTLIAAGVFPSDWVKSSSLVKSPFGSVFAVNNTSFFHFKLTGISPSICIKLVTKISSIGAMANTTLGTNRASLSMIAIGGTPITYFWDYPVSKDAVIAACTSSSYSTSSKTIEIGFGYTRNN